MDFSLLQETPLLNLPNMTALFVKLAFDLLVIYIIAKQIYFRIHKNRTYLFTMVTFNIIIFLVCYLLNHLTLGLGFSFGIFAIFSILRYRTLSLPIKEMTYLFISISIAIINALSNATISYSELVFTNAAIIGLTYILEKSWVRNEQVKHILYEKIDLIKPKMRNELLEDLRRRTGLDILRCEVGRIDFLKDVAEVRVYFANDDNSNFVSEKDSDNDDD